MMQPLPLLNLSANQERVSTGSGPYNAGGMASGGEPGSASISGAEPFGSYVMRVKASAGSDVSEARSADGKWMNFDGRDPKVWLDATQSSGQNLAAFSEQGSAGLPPWLSESHPMVAAIHAQLHGGDTTSDLELTEQDWKQFLPMASSHPNSHNSTEGAQALKLDQLESNTQGLKPGSLNELNQSGLTSAQNTSPAALSADPNMASLELSGANSDATSAPANAASGTQTSAITSPLAGTSLGPNANPASSVQGLSGTGAGSSIAAEASVASSEPPAAVAAGPANAKTESLTLNQTGQFVTAPENSGNSVENASASANAASIASSLNVGGAKESQGTDKRSGLSSTTPGLYSSQGPSPEGLNPRPAVNGEVMNGANTQASASGMPPGSLVSTSQVSEGDQQFRQTLEQTILAQSSDPAGTDLPDESNLKAEQASQRSAEIQSRLTQSLKPYTSTVQTAVTDPDWGQQMTEKVAWFASRNIQSAQIHLNPAELGPVDVKVSVQNDQTVVHFNVQNANVRELLEANVQRLRDMMDGNGVNLSEVNVDSGSTQQESERFAGQFQDGQAEQGSQGQAGTQQAEQDADAITKVTSSIDSISLVDAYA